MLKPVVNYITKPFIAGFHFYIPAKDRVYREQSSYVPSMAALLPTHNPTHDTFTLVEQLVTFNPNLLVIVIDDCTPASSRGSEVLANIRQLSATYRVVCLRTPHNLLKAGALNFGFSYISNLKTKPRVIFTLDDDVQINKDTLYAMARALVADRSAGAICSLAMTLNKNQNLLTRLQAFEYHSFNMTKIADNHFLRGPLVMQGMLTAFRYSALRSVGGFTDAHLIEDYDITARLKRAGWRVRIAREAQAWTEVPHTLESLWKQRVRWCYGGLHVAKDYWKTPVAVFQDLLGHLLFIGMLTLVILSIAVHHGYAENQTLYAALLLVTGAAIFQGLIINIITLLTMPERDATDWILKLALVPEFIYSNILSFVLIGSYLFLLYNAFGKGVLQKTGLKPVYAFGLHLFSKLGFSSTWGTKQLTLSKEVI